MSNFAAVIFKKDHAAYIINCIFPVCFFFALSNPVISCYRLTKSGVIHFTLQLHFSKKFSTPVGFCHTFNFKYGRCSLT